MDQKSILIIEDQEALTFLYAFDLKKQGFKTFITDRGEKGIVLAQKEKPDIILLDLMMPGIDGFETCRRLKADETTRDIPVILMSAKFMIRDRQTGLEVGAIGFLVKPFNPDELMNALKTILRIDT